MTPQRFSYPCNPEHPDAQGLPFLPLMLHSRAQSLQVSALLDSGSMVNVLPYNVGLVLGGVWEQQTRPTTLSGNLANVPAYTVTVDAQIPPFAPVRLAFAWTHSNEIPLILGQINFFLEFDVYFFGSQGFFEILPSQFHGKERL